MRVTQNNDQNTSHDQLHWQTGSYDDRTNGWAVRQGNWKLLGNPRDPNPTWSAVESGEDFKGKDRLFLVNLAEDIGENKNLADINPEKLQELLQLHKIWLAKINDNIRRN